MLVSSKPVFDPFHTRFVESATEFAATDLESSSLTGLFSKSAGRFPDRTAIQSDSHTLSYARVNAIANRVAHGILGNSTDSDALVGLCIDDTALLIAAVIGVLKSGKAYMILDPRYPDERLELLLRESGAKLVIGSETREGRLAAVSTSDSGVRMLSLDSLLAAGTEKEPGVQVGPQDLALVMYTSGSTGKPRGVAHTHRSILADVGELSNTMRAGCRDTWIQYAPMSFASSIRSTFGSLLTGGTLVLYDIERYGFSRLQETLLSRRITLFRSLPSTFRHFMGILDEEARFPDVRVVSLGGEAVTPTDIERFNRHFFPYCVLMTSYGPTECLGACWSFIAHGAVADGSRVPIGFARSSKSVSIMDEQGETVPDGVVGEIAVTGHVLSSGYWRDEDSTRRRFRQNGDGSRTFFTGDFGVRDRGVITLMGRKDHQVKIRGYRIDVLETEEHLRRIPGVEDAVVVARTGRRGEARLVAYILAAGDGSPEPSEARRRLEARLPHYLVPDAIEAVTAFPLNANGKIDRQAFPDPASWAGGDDQSGAWRTSTQRNIAGIWNQVGLNTVDTDRSFIQLGGDSLGAAQVASHLAQRFGVDVPMSFILDASIQDLEKAVHALKDGIDR